MRDKLLWFAKKWVDEQGLEHIEIYDYITREYVEEWHPVLEPIVKGSNAAK